MAEIEKIPQHKHCVTCGNAHVKDELYCGDACKEKKKKELGRKKRQLMIIEIVAVAMLVIAVVVSMT